MSPTKGSNQGIILNAVSLVFCVIALLVYGMRMYADVFILRSARADTYVASFTILTAIISQVFTTLSVHYGMGQYLQNLDRVHVMYSIKWSWMAQIFQLFANTTGKIAVMLYLTTFRGTIHRKANLAYLWTLGLLQIASVTVLIAFILTQCSPLQKLWDESSPGTCNGRIRNQNFGFFQGSLSAFTDVCLAVYPMVLFWNLQMKTAKKILLCVLFGFGLLAAVASIVKTTQLRRIGNTTDITYDLAYLITWNAADMYIVFIAGSIPTLSPWFQKYFSKSSTSDSRYSHNRHQMPLNGGDDDTTLTSDPMLPGRTKACASATGKKMASHTDDDVKLAWMGNGRILRTTDVHVGRDEGLRGFTQ